MFIKDLLLSLSLFPALFCSPMLHRVPLHSPALSYTRHTVGMQRHFTGSDLLSTIPYATIMIINFKQFVPSLEGILLLI